MADHRLRDPYDPDHGDETTDKGPPDVVDTKVKASALTTLAASLGFALANGYATTDGVLDPLPKWAQFPILLILPPLATFLAGYRTPSNRV